MFKKCSLAIIGLILFGAGCQQIVQNKAEKHVAPDGTEWSVVLGSGKIQSITDPEKDTIDGEHVFGSGFAPVTGYQTQTTARVSASATTIPVASVSDKAGNVIVPSQISSSSTVRMYFNFEAGSPREEPFYCTGISGLNLTNCVRGIAFQGSDLTGSSTIAQIHNAGASIIMTNLGVMYGNEFVGTSGVQTIYDTKTFDELPRATSTSAVPTNNAQLVTKFYADSLVAGGFSCSSASSTLGIRCSGVPAVFGININATSSGLFFGGTAASQLSVGTSSTGGVAVNGVGNLYIDTSDSLNWTANQTFSSGIFVNTPTFFAGTGLAANDIYVNQSIVWNTATATAQVAITAGQALWVSSTSSQVMVEDSSISTSTFKFIGFAANSVSAGSAVSYTKFGGVNCNQSALVPGSSYYLNGSSGQVTSTPGTFLARVGIATSANCIQVMPPKFVATGNMFVSPVGSTTTNIGFYPAHLEVRAGCASAGAAKGMSIGDETNTSVYAGNDNTNMQGGANLTKAFVVYCNSTSQVTGTVSARSATGFTISVDANAAGLPIYIEYVATSE